jgi:hypothetical protein
MGLTAQQVQRLITPRPAGTFESKQGMTYIPTHEAKAEMTRVFGPGNWDHTIHDVTLLYQREVTEGQPGYPKNGNGRLYYVVGYRVACTVRIRDYEGNALAESTEYHAEENAPLPNLGEAHAMALTSCESYAFRRAVLDFGDAFGLHLYDGGSVLPLIKGTLMLTEHMKEEHEALRAAAEERRAEAAAAVQARMKHDTTGEPAEEGA